MAHFQARFLGRRRRPSRGLGLLREEYNNLVIFYVSTYKKPKLDMFGNIVWEYVSYAPVLRLSSVTMRLMIDTGWAPKQMGRAYVLKDGTVIIKPLGKRERWKIAEAMLEKGFPLEEIAVSIGEPLEEVIKWYQRKLEEAEREEKQS